MSLLLFSRSAQGVVRPLTLQTWSHLLHSFPPLQHTKYRRRWRSTRSCSSRQHVLRTHPLWSPLLGGAGCLGPTLRWHPHPWLLWYPMCLRLHHHPMRQPPWQQQQPSQRPHLLHQVLHPTQQLCVASCTRPSVAWLALTHTTNTTAEHSDMKYQDEIEMCSRLAWCCQCMWWCACCSYTLHHYQPS